MEHRYVTTIEASRSAVFAVLADVGNYDRWLDTVSKIESDPESTVESDPINTVESEREGPAWFYTLRAHLGPFARSKRLRVVETVSDEPSHVRLERQERDDRDHAPWVFDATLAEGEARESTVATITLTYGGRWWTTALTTVLDRQLSAATDRLEALTRDQP